MKTWLIQSLYVIATVVMDALLRQYQVNRAGGADLPAVWAQWLCVLMLLDALGHPRLLASNRDEDLSDAPVQDAATTRLSRRSDDARMSYGGVLLIVMLMRVVLLMSMLVVPALRGSFQHGSSAFHYLHMLAAVLVLLLQARMLGLVLVPRPVKPSQMRELTAHALHAVLTATLLLQLLQWPQLREYFAYIHKPHSVAGLLLALLLNLFWFLMIYLPIRMADIGGQLRRAHSTSERVGVLLLAYALMIYALRP